MTALARYRERRHFDATPEPSGSARPARAGKRLRYVVQRHAARRLHFDFRLEIAGTLKSWAVPKEPGLAAGERRLAMHVEDHPLEYARFEGEIPKGQYGAGRVAIWDRGHWQPEGDPERGYRTGRLSFALDGERLAGRWSLVRMRAKAGETRDPWLLIRRSDGASRASRARAGAAALPEAIPFQLATPVETTPEGDGWLHELKLDGYRLACRIDHGTVRLVTRNGHDWTDRFPGIRRAAERIAVERAWLDGEAVVFDENGLTRFGALQAALSGGRGPIGYVAFDCLWLDDRDLRQEPLEERKRVLRRLLADAPEGILALDHVVGNAAQVFREACRHGAEGVVSKRRDDPYQPRRSASWQKIRCAQRQELVVGGYTPAAGRRSDLGALLLGHYDDAGKLAYVGRVGTGFDAKTRSALLARLRPLRRRASPFVPPLAPAEARDACWVRPELVVEVRFKEWTAKGRLRQAVYLGLRDDKEAREVVREAPRSVASSDPGARVAGVVISHPERVIDPETGLTKRDLARYYERVWPRIEPHLRDRALSVVRCPQGIADKCFFQKHAFPKPIAGVRAVESDGHPGLVVESREGLVGLVQNGVVELHAPSVRIGAPRHPDRIVLDLDPDPALPPDAVREEALRLHGLLAQIGLESFVKTTGGKGLHVVVPVSEPLRLDFPRVKAFTRALGRALKDTPGSLLVLEMAKARRRGRIYFDDVRNRPGATAVLPYSVRARPGAPVAFPLRWAALRRLRPPFSPGATEALRRLAREKAPAWPDLDSVRQPIPLLDQNPKRGK